MSPLLILQSAAEETGWNDNTQLALACEFLATAPVEVQRSFQAFIAQRVAEEQDMTEDTG